MPDVTDDLFPLLPVPRSCRRLSGYCRIGPETQVDARLDDARVARPVCNWIAELPDARGADDFNPGTRIRLHLDRHTVPQAQGYRLHVGPGEITVTGGSAAGCFHGLATLRQLAIPRAGRVPCCEIVDWPDFRTRGLLHDVTRGKVPTLDTLKLQAERLAALKVNQLQLYIEYAFSFSFDPEICPADEGLTVDEVRELDDYCRDRFIELVPAVATFGHMGRILSMPRYRHLAEIEAPKCWEEMDWSERARGLTLDCANPEAHRLVERIWTDVLDAFSSPVVNICGDEPWDLGKGKNAGLIEENRIGEAYVEQIRRTHDICAARGRRTQLWGDIMRSYPHLMDRLPRNATLLHWGYDENAEYAATAAFAASGHEVMVCPGTSGWKRILNAMDLAERNISTFAKTGVKHGAVGLLTTDWGDHGHFNSLPGSWHGISLGAAMGWRADHPTGTAFDELFAPLVLGVDDAQCVSLLRAASRPAEKCETWRLFYAPQPLMAADPTLPSREALEALRDRAARARERMNRHLDHRAQTGTVFWGRRPLPDGRGTDRQCRGHVASGCGDPHDWAELSVACRFSELFVERALAVVDSSREGRDGAATGASKRWADDLEEAGRRYADNWMARNKRGGLADILAALDNVADEMRMRKA